MVWGSLRWFGVVCGNSMVPFTAVKMIALDDFFLYCSYFCSLL